MPLPALDTDPTRGAPTNPAQWLVLLIGLLLAACAPSPAPVAFPAGDPAHPIVIAIAPATGLSGQAADEIAARLAKTGLAFKASLAPSSANVIDALGAGRAQIGWVDPLGYLVARKRYGADVGLVAVRRGSDHFNSQIITNAQAGIKTLGDLAGKSFCFAAHPSTGGDTIPRIILQANGIDPSRDLRTITIDLDEQIPAVVYTGVDCVAGATIANVPSVLQQQYPDAADKVVVLDASLDFPNDAIVFAKTFPPALRVQVTAALEEIATTPEGQQLLQVQGLVKQKDSAYDRLRDLMTKAGTDPAKFIQ